MSESTSEDKKQIDYRDARVSGRYDDIWQNVGKCAFCDLRSKYIIHEQNDMVLTVALFAYIDGHLMIVPRRHIRSVKELAVGEWETMREMMYLAKKLIRREHGIKGMQIVQKDGVVAQSTVEHLHFHCIPFDAPDMSVWNYRTLKNTPLQNAKVYQKQNKKITRLASKFQEKYGSK